MEDWPDLPSLPRPPAVRAVTNCTLWRFSGAQLATLLKHSQEFLPPLCKSYLQVWWDSQA